MVFIGSPLYVKLTTLSAFGAFGGVTSFFVWTKHCDMEDLPTSDPLFSSSYYHKFNPNGNASMRDVCVRRIPLFQIRPDLLADDKKGGGKLVETFAGGIFGGTGYSIQRLIHGRNTPPASETSALIGSLSQASSSTSSTDTPPTGSSPSQSLPTRLSSLFSSSSPSPSTPPTITTTTPTTHPTSTELWTKPSLRTSAFPQSTIITNHFLVLSRSPATSILLRCGDSPLTSPSSPRSSDGLFELSATTNYDRGYAEFTLKSIFYNGEAEYDPNAGKPMGQTMEWLHRQYTKLWMESGVGVCRMSKWRSLDKQREVIKEEMRREEGQTGGEGKRLLEERK